MMNSCIPRKETISTNCRNNNELYNDRFHCIVNTCFVLISAIVYIGDFAIDVLVCLWYYFNGLTTWMIITISILGSSLLVIQIFSFRWFIADGQTKSCIVWASHFFFLQPLQRFLDTFASIYRSFKKTESESLRLYKLKQNDLSMLRMFQSFLQSAPQLTLVSYIAFTDDCYHWITGVSAILSTVSVGWSVATYNHALRQVYNDNHKVNWSGIVVQMIYVMCILSARVISIVVFASVFGYWTFLGIGVHWIAMFVWILFMKTDFCPSRLEEILFNCVAAVVYCFAFVSLQEGRTRYKLLFFFSISFLENLVMFTMFYLYSDFVAFDLKHGNILVLVAMVSTFSLGLIFMLIYYQFCHPSTSIRCLCCRQFDSSNVQPVSFKYNNADSLGCVQSIPPQYASTGLLPRRNLLKQPSLNNKTEFARIYTPSQLSPICKKFSQTPVSGRSAINSPLFCNDSTILRLDKNFQHYSINASNCLQTSFGESSFYGVQTQGKSDTLESQQNELTRPANQAPNHGQCH